MEKVFITRNIPTSALNRLKSACDISQFEHNTPIDHSTLITGVKDKTGLFCLLTDKIDGEVMDASPGLKIISNCAAGYDNIDVPAATERGITVTNTPTALTEATADITWGLLLDAARRVSEGDRMVRRGEFKGWDLMLLRGVEIHGKTIGIVGAGRIGSAVARRAKGFGMKIIYHNRNRNEKLEQETGADYVDFDTLLQTSDFISLHTPFTPETKHLFGAREFDMMKDTAVFINTSRGKCHDEEALYIALKEGKIMSAGLDVYEEEPKVYPPLLELDNVVLAPHLGSATTKVREEMAEVAVDNLLAVLEGRTPEFVVNPEVLRS